MSNTEQQRRIHFEAAVIERMKESGFLEVEIRVECLQRNADGSYFDSTIDAYWHFWNKALDGVSIMLPHPPTPMQPEDAIDDSWLDAYNAEKRMRKTCVEAIEAAGLAVIP